MEICLENEKQKIQTLKLCNLKMKKKLCFKGFWTCFFVVVKFLMFYVVLMLSMLSCGRYQFTHIKHKNISLRLIFMTLVLFLFFFLCFMLPYDICCNIDAKNVVFLLQVANTHPLYAFQHNTYSIKT